MEIQDCNPYVRAAMIQHAVLEGTKPRMAYDYRLFYVLENEGYIILDGKEYALSPDSLIIIPPAVGYYFLGKMQVAVLNFDMTRSFSSMSEPICPPPSNLFDKSKCFDMTLLSGFESPVMLSCEIILRDAVLELVNGYLKDDIVSDALCSAKLKAILAEIMKRKAGMADSEADLAKRIEGYIRINAVQIRDNGEIAKAFGYHPVYLGEIFKRITGQTLHDTVNAERVRLACRWLTQTDLGIEEIATITGFCSRSHFCTVFKAKAGMTPKEYRKFTHN